MDMIEQVQQLVPSLRFTKTDREIHNNTRYLLPDLLCATAMAVQHPQEANVYHISSRGNLPPRDMVANGEVIRYNGDQSWLKSTIWLCPHRGCTGK